VMRSRKKNRSVMKSEFVGVSVDRPTKPDVN
jgi:hypothetical protein